MKSQKKTMIRRIRALFLAVLLTVGACPAEAGAALVSRNGADAKVADGYYRIIPYCAPRRTVTVQNASKKSGGNIYISNKNNAKPSKVFYIRSVGKSLYTIRNLNSGLYVETKGGGKSAHTNIQQGKYTGKNRQKWYIIKKNGRYMFQISNCRMFMTVEGSKNKNGANVWTQKYRGSKGQQFVLEKVSSSAAAKIVKAASTGSGTKKNASAKKSKSSSSQSGSSRTWNDAKDLPILTNIIGSIESGGHVYGKRDYANYEGAYANSSTEYTVTLGWACFYGSEAKRLVRKIYNKDPNAFKKIVKKYYPNSKGRESSGYKSFMKKVTTSWNWVQKRWSPNSRDKRLLIALITSDNGKKAQDELFQELMKTFVKDCRRKYTSNAWAVYLYCEIRHVGGVGAANRIFNRCKKKGSYSINSIWSALKRDERDHSSSHQVGDRFYNSRHSTVIKFLKLYAA